MNNIVTKEKQCRECDGSGTILVEGCDARGEFYQHELECLECAGKGHKK